jgi:Capsule polysaccharide biosynthesis protein
MQLLIRLRNHAIEAVALSLRRLGILRHYPGFFQWRRFLRTRRAEWRAQLAKQAGARRVLIAGWVGADAACATLEGLLTAALSLRGAQVDVLLCDSALPACLYCGLSNAGPHFAERGPQDRLCADCSRKGQYYYEGLGVQTLRVSESLSTEDRSRARSIAKEVPREKIGEYRLDNLAVGEHAMAGALRYFARGVLEEDAHSELILRRYFEAALLTAFALRALLKRNKYECAVFNHGIYVPHGVVGEVCREQNVRVVNWVVAYRKQRFIFSHGETYHHTLMTEPTTAWENISWTDELDAAIQEYLHSRWSGSRDWIWFFEKPVTEIEAINRSLGVDPNKPTIGMLTNVFWDAQLHYPKNVFGDMLEWTLETIEYFKNRPELQLIIRIHPAEVRGGVPSKQKLADEIARAYPVLPANVIVVLPENDVSTYVLMSQCDSVIIYGTKMGVELTSVGLPVIVAGEAWIKNKGVTFDPTDRADYFALLDQLPLRRKMEAHAIRRARMYAFHFFFRRMIPLRAIDAPTGRLPLEICLKSLDDLRPGVDAALDIVCNGVLDGSDFIYPAEEYAHELKEF